MLNDAFTVFQKVFELFLMASAGFVCGRKNIVSEDGARQITSILFYVVTPALIVCALQDTIGRIGMGGLLTAGAVSAAALLLGIPVAMCFFRNEPPERGKVLRFAAIYSNCGFVGLPLAQAVLGSTGVTYASVFIVVYNIIVWTHGLAMMRGGGKLDWKRALLNPGLIGMVLGLPLFAASYHLPEVILTPLRNFSNLNTPLAMIVIGTYIARVSAKEIFGSPKLYALSAVRLLLIPAVCLLALTPFHIDRGILASVVILAAAPCGANTVMFAAQFGEDVPLSSRAVALSTILSLVTMPLFAVAPSLL